MKRIFFFLAWASLIFFFIGFYFETNDDLQCDLLFRGLLAHEPLREARVLFPYLSTCFSFLYERFPSVPIYSLFVVASCILYSWLISRFLGLTLFLHSSFVDHLLLQLVLFLLLLLPHLVMIQFSRFALLVPYLCLLLLWVDKNRKLMVLYLVLFVLYSLLRSQSLPLVLLLFAFVVSAFLLFKPSSKVSAPVVLFISLASLFSFAALHWHQHTYIQSDPFLSNELPYIADIVNNHSGYSLQTKEDSTTFGLMNHWLMGDRQWLNHEHLAKIAPGKLVSWYKIKLKFYDFWENKVVMLLCTKYLVVSLFLLLILVKLYRHSRRSLYVYFSYLAVFLGLCGTITVLMKMPNHLAEPLICVLLLSSIFLLPNALTFSLIEKRFLLMAMLPFLGYSAWEYRNVRSEGENYSLAWQEVEGGICGKEIIVGDYSLSRFTNYPIFAEIPFRSCNEHLLLGGWTGWLPEIQDEIQHLTGERDLSALFKPHPDRLWLLSDGEDKIYEELVKQAYGKHIHFQPYGRLGAHMQETHMGWYTLAYQ